MTDLRAVPPLYRPTRRVSPKPHAVWIDEEVAAGRTTSWRSDTPVSDWWAKWRPAVVNLFWSIVGLAIFAATGWILGMWVMS